MRNVAPQSFIKGLFLIVSFIPFKNSLVLADNSLIDKLALLLVSGNIISLLKKAVDRGDKVFDMSLGEQCLDYTELKELSQMIEKIILQNKFNGTINCCSGKPIMVNELIQKSLKKWDRKINFNRGKYPYREFESLLIWGNRNLYKKIQ